MPRRRGQVSEWEHSVDCMCALCHSRYPYDVSVGFSSASAITAHFSLLSTYECVMCAHSAVFWHLHLFPRLEFELDFDCVLLLLLLFIYFFFSFLPLRSLLLRSHSLTAQRPLGVNEWNGDDMDVSHWIQDTIFLFAKYVRFMATVVVDVLVVQTLLLREDSSSSSRCRCLFRFACEYLISLGSSVDI